ncbi:unnamed protein product [Paramecium primaurelia]|uniref:Uncharacterized protein n=1 Tax=Paramecium primaurelia TaxID=5886 RepID=A0A8S1Q8K4_PARPR|nr:unnamed protein product [Paramecium primaurelia]
MPNSLKYLAIYRHETEKLIASYLIEAGSEEPLKSESSKVCFELKRNQLRIDERQKIDSTNGSWFCKIDDKGLFYLVLGISTYPERHAYTLIQEIQNEFNRLGNDLLKDDASLKLHIKKPLKDLGLKYNDLVSLDKIYQAQQNVDQTKIVMEDNIKQMINNGQQLDVLSIKAEDLNKNAKSFAKNSAELASIMYWRNMKLKIIIGLIILAGLLYIIVPIIIKVSASN